MSESTANQAQSTGATPGTMFYAPAVQLLQEKPPGPDTPDRAIEIPASDSPNSKVHPVHADIERAEVTQVHHGPCQTSITLNNQRHERVPDTRPISPSWKYNRLDHIKFGQKMLIRFGYALNQPGEDGNGSSSSEEKFQRNLMLRARITDMTFTFPCQGGSKVTLKGEDAISLLNTKSQKDKPYVRKNEIQIVKDVLKRSGSGLSLASGPRENVSGTIRSLTHRKGQSYFQFIEELAKRLDYEIWVDIDKPDTIHFEKSRSLELGGVIDLAWNKNLVEFKPKFKVWDTYTGATAGGRSPSRRRAIREVVAATEIKSDLHPAPDAAPTDKLLTAIEAREAFFSGEPSPNNATINVNNLDTGRAKLAAVAELRRSAREFLTADASTIGLPQLRPGIHVNIQKLYAPFDGIYYVTQAVHTIDNTGYRTKVKLRRPGMLDPKKYPSLSAGSQS